MKRGYGLIKASSQSRVSRVDWYFAVELPDDATGIDIEREGKRIAEEMGLICLLVIPLPERVARARLDRQRQEDMPKRH